MSRLFPIRLITLWMMMLTVVYGQVAISGGVTLVGNLTCAPGTPSGAPIFSLPSGTYAGPQTISISGCLSGRTMTVRTDGGLVNAASPVYSGPITLSAPGTYTISAICTTIGAYQSNTQASSTGTACHVGPNQSGSITFPSGVNCTYSGGVGSITPTNVVWTFPGGSSPSVATITTPAASSSDVEALFTWLFGGSADPSAPTCDTCTEQVKDVKFTVVGTGLDNQEFDMPQYDNTHGVNRQNGTQCQGSSGKIEVDSGNAGGWTVTAAPCNTWTNGTTHEEVNSVSHVNGDTGCGGNGCAIYNYIWIDGTTYPLNGNYGGTQGYNSESGETAWGWQFQPDAKKTTGTAATVGWDVASATVALTMGDESATSTATYTITSTGAATPVIAPFAIPNMIGNNANFAPTTTATGCAGTNPCLIFGNQKTGTASMAVPITISNCSNPLISRCSGSGSLIVSGMAVSGVNASDFTLSGSCGTISSGGDCEPTITFTPSASSGTQESATLTVYDNGTTSSQTMSLTGTSQGTVTTLSACGTLSSNTNYQLTSDVSATGSCFLFNGTNSDLNLNGHTITFCSTGGTSLVGGVFVSSFNEQGLMIHNGTIQEAAGKTCTGLTGSNGFGSADFMVSSAGSSSDGRANGFFNLYLSTNEAPGNNIFEEYAGASGGTTILHDVSLKLNGTFNCSSGNVGCRSADQFYSVVEDQGQNAGAWNWYNIGQTGGTQGGLGPLSPGSTVSYTLMSPGSTVATNSNGFAIQSWATGTVSHNLATGSGVGGALISARGGQLASINSALTGANISNNTFISTYLANNGEYSGCALGGAYAYQLNTAGNGNDLSNNTLSNNYWKTISGVCESYAFSDSGSTNGAGANVISNNHIEADIDPATYVSGNAAAGIRLDSCQYSPCPANAITFTGNTILGDTADIFVLSTDARTFSQDTFGKGTNPISGQLFIDFNHGINTGSSGLITVIDPTFTDGVTKSSNNLSTWATNNPSSSASYLIDWTYTVTVEQTSNSAPISGATVSITPANSGTPCSTTTNGSGVATCVLPDTLYRAVTGTYSTVSYNPMAITITASGCTTGNYSETITATTSETKKLSGC